MKKVGAIIAWRGLIFASTFRQQKGFILPWGLAYPSKFFYIDLEAPCRYYNRIFLTEIVLSLSWSAICILCRSPSKATRCSSSFEALASVRLKSSCNCFFSFSRRSTDPRALSNRSWNIKIQQGGVFSSTLSLLSFVLVVIKAMKGKGKATGSYGKESYCYVK